jgi:hypothetical protein
MITLTDFCAAMNQAANTPITIDQFFNTSSDHDVEGHTLINRKNLFFRIQQHTQGREPKFSVCFYYAGEAACFIANFLTQKDIKNQLIETTGLDKLTEIAINQIINAYIQTRDTVKM